MRPTSPLNRLQRQALIFLLTGGLVLLSLFPFTIRWWEDAHHVRWLALSTSALLYFTLVLWRGLTLNHREGEGELLGSIGVANSLTLLRSILLSMVVGFLLSPRPEGVYAWLPGVLYTLASLPDFVDGILARRLNQVTRLGEFLDMNVDSVGVLVASFLTVQYGVVPWWYLPIGLARYLFVLGIALRRRAGLPVHELPFSHRRRGFAALKMGFMFVMLFPLFGPPGTTLAAAAFGLPFAAGFLWDWGVVTGWIDPANPPRIKAEIERYGRYLPPMMRVLVVILIAPSVWQGFVHGEHLLLTGAETAVALLLLIGAAPRVAAILAVCFLGVHQNIAPLSIAQYLLVVVYIGLIFTGAGRPSLWPVEDALITRRFGEPEVIV